MTSTANASSYLSLLKDDDRSVQLYALKAINEIVDKSWSEISNDLTQFEEIYEDPQFPDSKLAALVSSKLYYNLGEAESAVKYALAAGDYFSIDSQDDLFVETIVSKSIEMYIAQSTYNFEHANNAKPIDSKLESVFERMLQKCIDAEEYKLALGIAIDSFRIDIVNKILKERMQADGESSSVKLINYVLSCAITTVVSTPFRNLLLSNLFDSLINFTNPDYFILAKITVNLNKYEMALQMFEKLTHSSDENSKYLSYQIAFDLVNAASQKLLESLVTAFKQSSTTVDPKLIHILSGIPTCDYYNTFLLKNRNIDIALLDKAKTVMDGKFSLYHNAVTISNGFMHCGTVDDGFVRNNLPWLGKAKNWAKFSATASLGVIHKGNLLDGKKVLTPYLPSSRNPSRYIKGGSLYGLGLVYAGFGGGEITSYLKQIIQENSANTEDEGVAILLHGASLGLGLSAMGTANEELYDLLTEVLYADSATCGEAAAYGIGLVMLGAGSEQQITDMINYAKSTAHGNITKGLATSVALMSYGNQELSDASVELLLKSENDSLRYGAAYTIGMAYAGTGENKAIKKLLHIAVSDSNDDVRRAAVTCLGFVLIRDYTTVPRIVELLARSHDAHIRCGTALALGISCAGRNLDSAIEILETLSKDPVDFVRQNAYIALAMVLIQQTEKTNPKVKKINETFISVMGNKHQEALAKFGASVAQGIMNAGGRNVTIQLENNEMGTLNTSSVVGLMMFCQFWHWYPLAHFMSLCFQPTTVIGVRGEDLVIPKFKFNCHTKEGIFDYPTAFEESPTAVAEKVATAVLSTSAKAKVRSKKHIGNKKDKEHSNVEKQEVKEEDKKDVPQGDVKETDEDDNQIKYVANSFKVPNCSRVLPAQLKYISFSKDERFVPVRKFKGNNGITVLLDKTPGEPVKITKTFKQQKDVSAPVPAPFKLEEELNFEDLV